MKLDARTILARIVLPEERLAASISKFPIKVFEKTSNIK
jgi:hypothetical protein